MKKSILLFASICAIAITSCKKDDPATTATTTATPVNPYTEIGLDQIGGNYSGSYLSYQDITDPNALVQKDENYSVEVSYTNNSMNIVINTSLNIPSSLKQFSIPKSEVTIIEINQLSQYLGTEYNPINDNTGTLYGGGSSFCYFKETLNIQLVSNTDGVEGSITGFYNGNDLGFVTLGGTQELIYTPVVQIKRNY